MISGTACTQHYYCYTVATGLPLTGDAANHTIRLLQDGVEVTPAASPAEIDSVNLPGWYKIALTGPENTGNAMLVSGKSSTGGANITGTTWANESSAPVWTGLTINGPVAITNNSGDAVSLTSGGSAIGLNIQAGSGTGIAVTAANCLDLTASADAIVSESVGRFLVADATGPVTNGIEINATATALSLVSSGDSAVHIESTGGGNPAVFITTQAMAAGTAVRLIGGQPGGGGRGLDVAQGDVLFQHDFVVSGAFLPDSITVANGMTVTDGGLSLTNTSGEALAFTLSDPTFMEAVSWLAALARYKVTQTATLQSLFAADGTTLIGSALVSNDGTTATLNRWS